MTLVILYDHVKIHNSSTAVRFLFNDCENNIILLFYISTTIEFSLNGCRRIMYLTWLCKITISLINLSFLENSYWWYRKVETVKFLRKWEIEKFTYTLEVNFFQFCFSLISWMKKHPIFQFYFSLPTTRCLQFCKQRFQVNVLNMCYLGPILSPFLLTSLLQFIALWNEQIL